MSVLGGSNRLGRIGTELVTHNTAGDMTELTESKLAMSYDAAARMSSTAHVPTGSGCADPVDCQVEIWHWYNAQGQRVLRDSVDGQTAYAYGLAGHEVLGEYGNAGRSSEHIWLPTASGPMPVAAVIDGEHFAVHADHLNTPRRLTDKNGVARWQWVYSGYGETQAQGLGVAVGYSLRYPGQVDDGSGLHYNWHRFYQPQTGRYTQPDPIGLGGGWNRFAYVGGNPLGLTDPQGLQSGAMGFPNIEGEFRQYRDGLIDGYSQVLLYAATDGLFGVGAKAFQSVLASCAAKGRVFKSSDPLVGDLATKIDAAYPGHVVGVNVPIRDAAGRLVTDADILLKNGVVQVKSGGGKGLTSQLQRTEQATGLPTIGYGPDLKPSILRGCAATNCERTLIEVVKP